MIKTMSSFYYGYEIVAEPFNGRMNLDEGSGEIEVNLPVGSYSLNTILVVIQNALNTQATQDYTVTADRSSRKITISSTLGFDLLTNSGSGVGTSPWSLLGFDTSADLTGASSYESTVPSGFEYRPQFLLQSYVSDDDFQQPNQAVKNVAADGVTVQTVSFGLAKFIKFDIKFITNRKDVADCINIEHNPTGVEDIRAFLQDITLIKDFEFNPDRGNPAVFKRVILESMPDFSDGTGYMLRELFDKNIIDVYETGVITLRVID